MRTVHQFVTFTVATPFQHAVAARSRGRRRVLRSAAAEYRARRDRLCDGLAAGLDVLPPEGTYFALADIRPLGYDDDEILPRLPERSASPQSRSAPSGRETRHLVRFAFCKRTRRSTKACGGCAA